ncbi:hypothetical protein [Mycobacterium sp. GA-2829]|uniref:hypothetical protein n=1 Tax=Mycobacterium sp. GA-2829 TaxID=1772283 RepID=UPI0012F94C96|nr:hypothetical protein [Mycobacterium sp. GA-2829]
MTSSQDGKLVLPPMRVRFGVRHRPPGAGPAAEIAEPILKSYGQPCQRMQRVGDCLLVPSTFEGRLDSVVNPRLASQLLPRAGEVGRRFSELLGAPLVAPVDGSTCQRCARLICQHHQQPKVAVRGQVGSADDECALDRTLVFEGKRPTPRPPGYRHGSVST